MPIIQRQPKQPEVEKAPSNSDLADQISHALVSGLGNAVSEAMAQSQTLQAANIQAIESLKTALTKSGNKIVTATVQRDEDNLIKSVTMQVTTQ